MSGMRGARLRLTLRASTLVLWVFVRSSKVAVGGQIACVYNTSLPASGVPLTGKAHALRLQISGPAQALPAEGLSQAYMQGVQRQLSICR